MAQLATRQQLEELFERYEQEGVVFADETESAGRIGLFYGQIHSTDYLFRWRYGQFNMRHQSCMTNANVYLSKSGKTPTDVMVDFFYHWRTRFTNLISAAAIRERIASIDTCGAIATAIAVNIFQVQNGSTDVQIKELLKGSHWRWIKTPFGDWVQKTLYGDIDIQGRTLFVSCNQSSFAPANFVTGGRLANVRALTYYLEACVIACTPVQVDESEELLSYDARATNHFSFKYGNNKRYTTALGVELELENHSKAEFKSLKALKSHAIFKRDGSVRTGVEICTAPATLDLHLEAFKGFFDAMVVNNSKLEAKDNCGLHVHIDRKKLSTLHVASLCLLLNNKDNERAICSIAGRAANSYCERTDHSYYDFSQCSNQSNRYRRVNLTNSATVELRLFAATTDYSEFKLRLEFTQAAVDYTRPGETSLSVKLVPIWDNFKTYVKQKASFYPELFHNMFPEVNRKAAYVPV